MSAPLNVRAAIEAHRATVLKDEGLFTFDGTPLASDEEINASGEAVKDAWNQLMSTPCQSGTDVSAKIHYVLNGSIGSRDHLLFELTGADGVPMHHPENCLPVFLRSLLGGLPSTFFGEPYERRPSPSLVFGRVQFQPL